MTNQMAEVLNIDEIKSRNDGRWAPIGDPVADECLTVNGGYVSSNSRHRDEIYRKGRELKPPTSPPSSDVGIVL